MHSWLGSLVWLFLFDENFQNFTQAFSLSINTQIHVVALAEFSD